MTNEQFKTFSYQAIDKIRNNHRNRMIWIYGAGGGGKIFLDVAKNSGIEIAGFCDNYIIGDIAFGYPIKAPKELDYKRDYVVIAVMSEPIILSMMIDLLGRGFSEADIEVVAPMELPGVQKEDYFVGKVKIGRYTYVNSSFYEVWGRDGLVESIGRFCSINHTASIWPNHAVDTVSSFMLSVEPFDHTLGRAMWIKQELFSKEKITIGNDVWIGADVHIMPGVHIGDGAIIGAGAVVTKNVDPYDIVGGIPAKHIKSRYSKDIINKMISIKWWNWNIETIVARQKDFYDIELFCEKYYTE